MFLKQVVIYNLVFRNPDDIELVNTCAGRPVTFNTNPLLQHLHQQSPLLVPGADAILLLIVSSQGYGLMVTVFVPFDRYDDAL